VTTTDVLVADDHALFRAGLIEILRRRFGESLRVTEAETFADTVAVLEHSGEFDLVFCDLDMPDLGRGRNLSSVVFAAGQAPVVVISASLHQSSIRGAFELGVRGYLPKRDSLAILDKCLDEVLAGRTYSPDVGEDVVVPRDFRDHARAEDASPSTPDVLAKLTNREQRVLAGVLQGLSNKEIARQANVSDATIKVHMRSIFDKLNVSNRTQAAMWAVQRMDAPALRDLVSGSSERS
jgi:DNA-binding NarL/FixJ family response regulator